MDIPSKFVSKEVEDKWYAYWQSNQFFKSLPDKREPPRLPHSHRLNAAFLGN